MKKAPVETLTKLFDEHGAVDSVPTGGAVVVPPGRMVLTSCAKNAAGLRKSLPIRGGQTHTVSSCVNLLMESYPSMWETPYKKWQAYLEAQLGGDKQ